MEDFNDKIDEIMDDGKKTPKTYEAELVEDIMSLVASSSSKVYGKRSAENRKKKKENETNSVI